MKIYTSVQISENFGKSLAPLLVKYLMCENMKSDISRHLKKLHHNNSGIFPINFPCCEIRNFPKGDTHNTTIYLEDVMVECIIKHLYCI